MDKLRQLIKAIKKVDSSITKLEFGCQILIDYNVFSGVVLENTLCKVIDTERGLHNGKIKIQTIDFGYEFIDPEKDIKKIVGKDITLENCWFVLREKGWTYEEARDLFTRWECNKPLHLQSTETIEFLWELLFN